MRTRRQRGQVLILMSVLMVGMLGLTGLVTDVGTYFFQNRVQQNAAETASRAATNYWVGRLASAKDNELWCVAQLYASSASYQALVPAQCPASATSVPDNSGQGVKVYYVDGADNQLGPVGTHGAIIPTLIPGNATATGIRVTTTATSGAYFSRIFNITGFAVNDTATNRMGNVISITHIPPVIPPIPGGGPQPTLDIFPASFNLATYLLAHKYGPNDINPIVSNYSPSCADFCWSGLQCTGNHGNATVTDWLKGGSPCPDMPGTLATYNSPICTTPTATAACTIAVDPGVRAADFAPAQTYYAGKVVVVPIVGAGAGYDKIVQFAYFYVVSATGPPAKTINGYFLDPALMPLLPAGISGPCVPGSFIPCSIIGG